MTAVGGKVRKPRLGERLSARELEIVTGLADGLSSIDIGKRLGIAELTVKAHLRRIACKLGTGDRTGMVAVAFRAGILPVSNATPAPAPGRDAGLVAKPDGMLHLEIPAALYDELLGVAAGVVNGKPLPMLRASALRAVHDARAHVRDPRAGSRRLM